MEEVESGLYIMVQGRIVQYEGLYILALEQSASAPCGMWDPWGALSRGVPVPVPPHQTCHLGGGGGGGTS